MEAQNPLSELADIHLPGEVSWWPLAAGWWLLLIVLLALAAWGLVTWLRLRHRKALLQGAIAELDKAWRLYLVRTRDAAGKEPDISGKEAVKLLNRINAVLRRVALVHFPDIDVAGLTGEQWLAFLDSCDNNTYFTEKAGKVLGDASYRQRWEDDPAPVYKLAKAWIHRRYLLDSSSGSQSGLTAREVGA